MREQYVFECIITYADILQNRQLLSVNSCLQCFLTEDNHNRCRSLGDYATVAVHYYANIISILQQNTRMCVTFPLIGI